MSKFKPIFNLTASIVNDPLRIEVAKERISLLPLTISVLASLRESAKLSATHYSTMIEGNRLSSEQVKEVIQHKKHIPHKKRDELEVLRQFDPLQKTVLILFKKDKYLTNQQISEVLQVSTQVGAVLCKKWVISGFIEYANSSKKARKYQLTKEFEDLIVKKII